MYSKEVVSSLRKKRLFLIIPVALAFLLLAGIPLSAINPFSNNSLTAAQVGVDSVGSLVSGVSGYVFPLVALLGIIIVIVSSVYTVRMPEIVVPQWEVEMMEHNEEIDIGVENEKEILQEELSAVSRRIQSLDKVEAPAAPPTKYRRVSHPNTITDDRLEQELRSIDASLHGYAPTVIEAPKTQNLDESLRRVQEQLIDIKVGSTKARIVRSLDHVSVSESANDLVLQKELSKVDNVLKINKRKNKWFVKDPELAESQEDIQAQEEVLRLSEKIGDHSGVHSEQVELRDQLENLEKEIKNQSP